MGEYDRKQREQLCRTITNSKPWSKQLKGFDKGYKNVISENISGVRQLFEVHRFIKHSHSNANSVSLKDNSVGNAKYGADMNYQVNSPDGMSTFRSDFIAGSDWQKTSYVAPLQVQDTCIAGGDPVNGPFEVDGGLGYFAYNTPQYGSGDVHHYSINKNNNWDGTTNAGVADVNDIKTSIKADVKENPQKMTTKTVNQPWT